MPPSPLPDAPMTVTNVTDPVVNGKALEGFEPRALSKHFVLFVNYSS